MIRDETQIAEFDVATCWLVNNYFAPSKDTDRYRLNKLELVV